MEGVFQNEPDAAWEQLSPLLDEAMTRLRDKDRDALVLRFFENKSLHQVGLALRLEERAAQKQATAHVYERVHELFRRLGSRQFGQAVQRSDNPCRHSCRGTQTNGGTRSKKRL